MDVVGVPVRKHSFNATNACETEAPIRKPLSQVTALSSKTNAANALEELNDSQNRAPLKVVPSNMLPTTPSKQTFVTDEEEKRNPEMTPSQVPTTPTVSESMQTARTPACTAALFAGRSAEIPPTTPKEVPILVTATPPTVSVPMQMSVTPAQASIPLETRALKMPEEREYSFEERRAGFVIPITHLKPVQV